VQNRESLISALTDREIYCGIHYPVPVHLQEAYETSGIKNGSCPVAERCAKEYVSLPMFSELTSEQQHFVGAKIKENLLE
jgi:dTDP-4-amino-4,6-dideoxygalactose transaminase